MKTEQLRKKKKRRKKRYLLKFFILVLLVIAAYQFLNSSIFDITKLTVENNNHYTKQQIISIANAKTGENIFKISTVELRDKLLNDPYIKSAKISRKLPDQVVLTVEERKEEAAVIYGNSYILIDLDGMVLRRTDAEPPLPLLVGMTLTSIEPGTPLEVEENATLTDSLKLLKQMGNHDIYFKKIEVSPVIIKAYIYDNLTCQGTPESIIENMDYLQEVLYDLYVQGIERGVIKVGTDGYFSFNPLVE
ncbi:MAG: FtsQ-type POTRA domain-containing protein [Clostridiales bacterium]|jgi:cell division protein FtsQ|nr:FtsQ-type POTRA domain-containing protein [Clostridiales bacterium]